MRAVGAGFAGFPLLRPLREAFAQSTGAPPPQRFVTLYHPHGIAAEPWVMRSSDSETNFSLTFTEPMSSAVCPLQPLEPHKSKLLVIEGVDLFSNANGHDSAGTILTGSRIDTSASRPQAPPAGMDAMYPGRGASLDQFLAVEKGLGKSTAVTSIELAVGTDSVQAGETLSFSAGGLPLPKIIDPVQAYDRLFAGFVVSEDPAARAAEMRRQRLGKGLVDFLAADARRLRTRLSSPEQAKLDQHLTALSELEKQLVPTGTGTMMPTCPMPVKPGASAFPKLKRYNGGEPYFDAITDAMLDVLALAVACDRTRFATLYMADLSFADNPLSLPVDNHQGVAHTYNGSNIGSNGNPVGAGNPSTWAVLAKFNRYSYGKVARFLDKLTQYGVVDSTLVYASSDMGNPALHSSRNVPTVLAGGLNGKFRMGRRIKAPADCPASNLWCSPGDNMFQGTANNHLLVSIAQAFGVAIDAFGVQPSTKDRNGPLTGLT
jgi:hypothetical protein